MLKSGPTGERYVGKEDVAMLACWVSLNSTPLLHALSEFSGASATAQIAMSCSDTHTHTQKKTRYTHHINSSGTDRAVHLRTLINI